MALLDVTADDVHTRKLKENEDKSTHVIVGKKLRGRLLYNFPLSDTPKLGFSTLQHILDLQSSTSSGSDKVQGLSVSDIVSEAAVVRVEDGLGIYLAVSANAEGFAHISRLSDHKIDSISETVGPYKIGSHHKARILDYNPIDNLFLVSLQPKVIEQPFLRVEDVKVGQLVDGKVSKVLIGENGITGLIVDLTQDVSGLVPSIHLSDSVLQHPEKKFREGISVKARVLSTDPDKRQVRLTLKKTLVNSDQKVWKTYDDVAVGDTSPGTLVKVDSYGALVQFYGSVKGFLPVSEMSEAYIKDATEHFRVGQVVTVHAINVNAEDERMTVSCRDPSVYNLSAESTLASLIPGTLVKGTVFEKSNDDVLLRLEGSNVIARLPVDHVSDGSERKRLSAINKIRVGQTLQDLLILDVQLKRRLVSLSNRNSLIDASGKGTFLRSFENLREGMSVTGYISNITSDGVFVAFAGGISALMPKNQVLPGTENLPGFGFTKLQCITARVLSIDYRGSTPRFFLTLKEPSMDQSSTSKETSGIATAVIEPIDGNLRKVEDLNVGKVIKVRVASVKQTQINVDISKGVQGRIDISEVYDDWDEIKDRKKPLQGFSPKEILSVRILGAHDARNHKFLPISHRSGRTPVFELSVRPRLLTDPEANPISWQDMKQGTSWLAFVNNVSDDCLWVNISPNVRGRVRAIDVSDDLSLAGDLETHFPVGSALRVRVISVDTENSRLDLSGKQGASVELLSVKDITQGSILPGRVTKVSERQILVQLSDALVGAVDLIDMADDYTQANPVKYQKNDIVRVYVSKVDVPNKKILLSMRASRVLSSLLPVQDPEISSVDQVKVQEIYRGFISHVADNGIFVTLGHGVTGFVRVSNLSDAYLKEWKDDFQRDQLVQGRVLSNERNTKHVQLSLKESVLVSGWKPPLVFADLKVGDIVTGKVAKVETFGVFILVDNSENVRGLCHRSEIAEQRVEDASKLFNEGDIVKAKVLKVEAELRRVNFGLKRKYFEDAMDEDVVSEDENFQDPNGGVVLSQDLQDGVDEDEVDDEGIVIGSEDEEEEGHDVEESEEEDAIDEDLPLLQDDDAKDARESGLKVRGFDWFGMSTGQDTTLSKRSVKASDSEDESLAAPPKKKRRRAEIQIDKTGDLDANGPQSVDDYERLLLGEPDSSLLWLQYMTFHLELGDVEQARQIGERALKSIGLAQDAEKLNIWIALLNLENAYGDDETVEAIFKRACNYNDPQDIYSRLTSIYIQSGKHDKADEMFQQMLKKFTQDPKIWINYATFLMDTVGDAEKARVLLSRALQTLPKFTHLDVTSKFAQLEFRSSAGLPERGRTIFEGLFDAFPKRVDQFSVLLDLEMKLGDVAQVRSLFERIFAGGSSIKAKPAKFFFKRWLAFEEKEGDEESVEQVKERAKAFVKKSGGGGGTT